MGCNAVSGMVQSTEVANLEHKIVHLVVTNQTTQLI
jgi:hypothetical protein